jgi:hypothetical protein
VTTAAALPLITAPATMSAACDVLDGRVRHDESSTAARAVVAPRDRLRGGVLPRACASPTAPDNAAARAVEQR